MMGMGIYYVLSLIILVEAMFFNFVTYLDAEVFGPMMLGMAAFIGLITFGKQLETALRFELAIVIGAFSILFGIFSGLLIPEQYTVSPFVFSPFWVIFGATSIIIGNELNPPEKDDKKGSFKKYLDHIIIGTGLFMTVIFITRLATVEHDTNRYLSYISDICWLGVGLYLVSFRLVQKKYSERMLVSVKLSLPLGIGFIFILFGIFLCTWEKLAEGIIEILIGAVVIRYGFTKQLYSANLSELVTKISFPVFLLVAEGITFFLILLS